MALGGGYYVTPDGDVKKSTPASEKDSGPKPADNTQARPTRSEIPDARPSGSSESSSSSSTSDSSSLNFETRKSGHGGGGTAHRHTAKQTPKTETETKTTFPVVSTPDGKSYYVVDEGKYVPVEEYDRWENQVRQELRKAKIPEEMHDEIIQALTEGKEVVIQEPVVNPNVLQPPSSGYYPDGALTRAAMEQQTAQQEPDVSPIIKMVAKPEDWDTIAEGEKQITSKYQGGFPETAEETAGLLYGAGKTAQEWGEQIYTKTKDILPLDRLGWIGTELEEAAGLAASGLFFFAGTLEQGAAVGLLGLENLAKGDVTKEGTEEFLERTGEYTVHGTKTQIEFAKEHPVATALLFAGPEIAGNVNKAVNPSRIPYNAIGDVSLKFATEVIPYRAGRVTGYEVTKTLMSGGSKFQPRENIVFHGTNVENFLGQDVVTITHETNSPVAGLYTGPELYGFFAERYGGRPGGLLIETSKAPELPKRLEELVYSDRPSGEVYRTLKQYVENTPGEFVVSPQTASGVGYRPYGGMEVEAIITPGTRLHRIQNFRSRFWGRFGRQTGEYYTVYRGQKLELVHMAMEGVEGKPLTAGELYRLKGRGLKHWAEQTGRRITGAGREFYEIMRTAREEGLTESIRRASKDIQEMGRRARDEFRVYEDYYRRQFRSGLRRGAFNSGRPAFMRRSGRIPGRRSGGIRYNPFRYPEHYAPGGFPRDVRNMFDYGRRIPGGDQPPRSPSQRGLPGRFPSGGRPPSGRPPAIPGRNIRPTSNPNLIIPRAPRTRRSLGGTPKTGRKGRRTDERYRFWLYIHPVATPFELLGLKPRRRGGRGGKRGKRSRK
ncbi:hypothetical protein [Geoglobus ahangari]